LQFDFRAGAKVRGQVIAQLIALARKFSIRETAIPIASCNWNLKTGSKFNFLFFALARKLNYSRESFPFFNLEFFLFLFDTVFAIQILALRNFCFSCTGGNKNTICFQLMRSLSD
jgi:hypothetical protein